MNGESFGAGVPFGLGKGVFDLYPGDEYAETDKEGNNYFHYQFMPFTAQQVVIIEVENPGAILKVIIGYQEDGKKDITREKIYSGEIEVIENDFNIRNVHFQPTKGITDVWLYMDFDHAEGMNRIAGVALTNFEEPYTPEINLPENEPFEYELEDMNDDTLSMFFGDLLSPTGPIISVDRKYIYFTSLIKDPNKAIWDPNTTVDEGVERVFVATLGNDGKIKLVEMSNYNLDDKVSTTTSLTGISQDNNVMYLNTLNDYEKLEIFRVSMTKDKDGYAEYHREKIRTGKYENQSKYMNEIMSYDERYLITTMWKEDNLYEHFERDLYVAKKIKKSQYGEFIRMGDDINSIGAEVPCFLAPDNKTLFFASEGHIGFGEKDIFVSRRLDDTWQNWSQPVNLGPAINSEGTENYFMVDSWGEYAYVVKWGTDKDGFSDIFRIKIIPPEPEEKVEQTVKPEPVVVIQGKVLNKKDNTPVHGNITYYDIHTKESMGEAESNSVTGEYSIALPKGILYNYEAMAENFISESNNIDTRDLDKTTTITRDLLLVPIEVGEIIQLNNIFFETAKAQLKKESDLELEKLFGILTTNTKLKIEISGHTDNVGSDSDNLKLSQDRADAVVNWLVEKGIESKRIIAKGYGESNPIASNESERGRQLNRRVEFKILKR